MKVKINIKDEKLKSSQGGIDRVLIFVPSDLVTDSSSMRSIYKLVSKRFNIDIDDFYLSCDQDDYIILHDENINIIKDLDHLNIITKKNKINSNTTTTESDDEEDDVNIKKRKRKYQTMKKLPKSSKSKISKKDLDELNSLSDNYSDNTESNLSDDSSSSNDDSDSEHSTSSSESSSSSSSSESSTSSSEELSDDEKSSFEPPPPPLPVSTPTKKQKPRKKDKLENTSYIITYDDVMKKRKDPNYDYYNKDLYEEEELEGEVVVEEFPEEYPSLRGNLGEEELQDLYNSFRSKVEKRNKKLQELQEDEVEEPSKDEDYSNYELLSTLPDKNDVIAFKKPIIVDFKQTTSPYIKGKVLKVSDKVLDIQLDRNSIERIKDYEYLTDQGTLEINYSILIEPKLIDKSSVNSNNKPSDEMNLDIKTTTTPTKQNNIQIISPDKPLSHQVKKYKRGNRSGSISGHLKNLRESMKQEQNGIIS